MSGWPRRTGVFGLSARHHQGSVMSGTENLGRPRFCGGLTGSTVRRASETVCASEYDASASRRRRLLDLRTRGGLSVLQTFFAASCATCRTSCAVTKTQPRPYFVAGILPRSARPSMCSFEHPTRFAACSALIRGGMPEDARLVASNNSSASCCCELSMSTVASQS